MPFTKQPQPEHGEKRHPKLAWPTDLRRAKRLELVARYARLGYTPSTIERALQKQLPPDEWVDVKQVGKDVKFILDWWRQQALGDAELIFGEIDEHFRQLQAEALKLSLEVAAPHWEPHQLTVVDELDPATGQTVRIEKRLTADGREAQLLPAATPGERVQILTAMQRILTARSMHHFGSKGAGSVTLIQNTTQVNAEQAVVASGNPALTLRDRVGAVRELLAEEKRGGHPKPPRLALPTGSASRADPGAADIIDGEATELDWGAELEAVAVSRGAQGRMDAQGDVGGDDAAH